MFVCDMMNLYIYILYTKKCKGQKESMSLPIL